MKEEASNVIASQVVIDCDLIRDWPSFHKAFQRVLGFQAFCGRNMDAWIDCMTSIDASEDGMSTVHCAPGSILTLVLEHSEKFAKRCPEQYRALIDCAAFVNKRRVEVGESEVLALSLIP